MMMSLFHSKDLQPGFFKTVTLLIFLMLVFCFAGNTYSANVTVSWAGVSQPGVTVTGYRVYYGTKVGYYTTKGCDVTTTNCAVSGLHDGGTYHFVVTAYNGYGESGPSDPGSYTVPDSSQTSTSTGSTCVLDPKFKLSTLSLGMEYYTDRDYRVTSVPSTYIGLNMIKTPNDERNLTTTTNYITFEMPDDGTVFVAYDSRAISEPSWMNGFIDTGDIIQTSLSSQPCLKIYSKNFDSGDRVIFGANKAQGFAGDTVSNYIVFYGKGGGVQDDCTLNTKFEETDIKVTAYYYTDRDYTITGGLADWMIGRTLIQTPNDERSDTSGSGYVRFTNPVDWWVYVLFDSRASSIPNWLKGWELRGEKITTSLSSQPYLKLYRKQFAAGQCVDLGGNYGPGSSGETRSNYVVVYGK